MFVEGYGVSGGATPDDDPEKASLFERATMFAALGMVVVLSEYVVQEFFEGFMTAIHHTP